jgi:hypothetical protein
VNVRDAHGKGPEQVVDYAIRQSRNAAFDLKAILLDTDLQWPPKTRSLAARNRIELVPASPCLEGFLLDILDGRSPDTSRECKERLQALLSGKPTQPDSYSHLFPLKLLEQQRTAVRSLHAPLDILAGRRPGT